MNGIKLMAKYALTPTKNGDCGPKGSYEVLHNYLKGMADERQAKEKLVRYSFPFGIAYAYQDLIAQANELNVFDERVVEAYWIGNDLLDNVQTRELREMIGKFYKWYKRAYMLSQKIPNGCKPFHNFHVLYFTSITGKVEPTLQNKNHCMILPATIKKIDEDVIILMKKVLNKDFEFEQIETSIPQNQNLENNLKQGDAVSIHRDTIIQKLTKEKQEDLIYFTKNHLELLS